MYYRITVGMSHTSSLSLRAVVVEFICIIKHPTAKIQCHLCWSTHEHSMDKGVHHWTMLCIRIEWYTLLQQPQDRFKDQKKNDVGLQSSHEWESKGSHRSHWKQIGLIGKQTNKTYINQIVFGTSKDMIFVHNLMRCHWEMSRSPSLDNWWLCSWTLHCFVKHIKLVSNPWRGPKPISHITCISILNACGCPTASKCGKELYMFLFL